MEISVPIVISHRLCARTVCSQSSWRMVYSLISGVVTVPALSGLGVSLKYGSSDWLVE